MSKNSKICVKIIQNQVDIVPPKLETSTRPQGLAPFLNDYGLTTIIGLPASGKTSLIYNLVMGTKDHKLYNKMFNSVYYISPSQTINIPLDEEKVLDVSSGEELNMQLNNVINTEKDIGEKDDPHHVLVILDDCVSYLSKDKHSLKLFRKLVFNARHTLGRYSALSLWLVSQKIKSVPLEIRSNALQYIMFESNRKEMDVFVDEAFPISEKEGASKILEYCYKKPHSFIFINVKLPRLERVFCNFNQLLIERNCK